MYTLLSKKDCSQCEAVVRILTQKNIPFEKKMLDSDFDIEYVKRVLSEMTAPLRTFPIVLEDNKPVGGYKYIIDNYMKG